MGSINTIWKPKYWYVKNEGISKYNKEDIIYDMVIGEGWDYEYYEITEFISKVNYEKIILGEYSIKTSPSTSNPVIIFDKNNSIIPLVRTKRNSHENQKVLTYK